MDDNSSNDSESQTFDTFTLKERNTILEQENLSLKSQIDDAVNITNKLDLIQKQNLELSQEIINLKTANDNLQCRLQISLQTNADLLKSLESQKVNFASQIQNDRLSSQNEATKLKEKYKAHNDQLYNELSQIKAQNDELQVNQKVFSNKIQHLLESAAQFFTTKFTTLDDLTSFFKQTSVPPAPTNDSTTSSPPPQSSDLIPLIKNLKKKLKIMKSQCQKTEEKYQDLQLSTNRETAVLQRKLEFLQKEKSESDSSYESTIRDLKNQLNESKETLENVKQELKKAKQAQSTINIPVNDHQMQSYIIPTENVSEPITRNKTDSIQLESLQSRINDLSSEVTLYQKRQSELQEQNRKLESAAQNAEIKLTKITNDLNSLQIVHNESLAEIESLRKSLHERKSLVYNQKPVPIIIQENPDKRQLARKEARINELTADLKKREIENEELSSKVRDLELTLSSKDDEYKKLKADHNEYVIRAESRHNVTQDDLIPPGSFRYSNFDPELASEIDKIASNSSLQIPSKIEHSFRTIDEHYSRRICEVQQLYEKSIEVETNLRNRVKQFITDVAIELTGQPLPVENNNNNNGNSCNCPMSIFFQNLECIQKIISEFVNRLNNIVREKEQLSSVIAQVSSVLQTDDIVARAGQLSSQVIQLSKRVLMMKKRCKALAKDDKEKGEKLNADLARLNSELELSQSNTSQLEAKIDSQNDTIKKLRLQIRSLQNELNDASEAKKELEATLTENAENELGSLNSKCRQIESQYSQKINGLQQQITDFQDENSSLQSKISYLEKQNKDLLEKIQYLNSEKVQLTSDAEEKIQSLNKKFTSEKASLKKSFESAFEEMKKKNEQSRSDIEQLSRSNASKDATIEDLQKSVKILTLQKVKSSNEARSLREQIGREKKLAEATLKSQTCSIETKYKEKIESIKAIANEEQHKMVLYVIDAFRTSFCGFIGKMEDKPFKILIDRIKESYLKLKDSDQAIRRMLNVGERQTTQDAVAQLLINH